MTQFCCNESLYWKVNFDSDVVRLQMYINEIETERWSESEWRTKTNGLIKSASKSIGNCFLSVFYFNENAAIELPTCQMSISQTNKEQSKTNKNILKSFLLSFLLPLVIYKAIQCFSPFDGMHLYGTSVRLCIVILRLVSTKKIDRSTSTIYGTFVFAAPFIEILNSAFWNVFISNSHRIKHAFLCISFFRALANVFRINLPQLRTSR